MTYKRNALSRNLVLSGFAGILLLSQHAFSLPPAVVVDFQQPWLSSLNQPQGLFSAKNGTIYVADSGNGRVLAVSNGTPTVVSTPGLTLSYPDAVAIDATGNLFIADEDSATVIEVPVSGSPSLVAGPPMLAFPSALATDSNGNLFIGDAQNGAVYEVPSGGGTITQVNITGISSVLPAAMAMGAGNNLYIADANSSNLYEVPPGGGPASNVTPAGFTLNQPSALAFDSIGNFYVLDSYNERVIEVPASDATHPYQVPVNGLTNPSGLAADAAGNLYVADYSNNDITEVLYNGTPVDLGQWPVGTLATSSTLLTYEFNQPTDLGEGQILSGGDVSGDIVGGGDGTTCQITDYTDNPIGSGNLITPQNPLVCIIAVAANPLYPGLRELAAQLLDDGGAVLASTPLNETGLAPVAMLSPTEEISLLQGFYAPSQIAVSGENNILYVADSGTDDPGTANVYGWNASSDSQFTVNTGSYTLRWPSGLALNRNGDLYISDVELGEVIVVPATGASPYKLNTGTLLETPVALAFSPHGDLIIGDNGPEGFEASTTQPGLLVEVPHNGAHAFVLNTGPIVPAEPDALAFTPSGDLYVADAGPYNPDTQTYNPGQVVLIPHDGSTPSVVNVSGFLPAGVSVDPAGDLDVLFAYPASITVVPPNGGSPYSLPFTPAGISDVNTLTPVNGGQNLAFSVDDEGNGSVQGVVGFAGILSFPATGSGSQSAPLSAAVVSAGNLPLTLGNPAFTPAGQSANFPDGGSTTCTDSLVLVQTASCTLSAVFAPDASGDFSATMTLSSNSFLTFGTRPVVSLSGTTGGDPPEMVRAPSGGVRSPQGHGRRHVRRARGNQN